MADKLLVPAEHIEHAILLLRGQKVILDSELAALERKYDGQFKMVFEAIREMMVPARKEKPSIGFRRREA